MSQLNSEPATGSHFGQNDERWKTPELLKSLFYFIYLAFMSYPLMVDLKNELSELSLLCKNRLNQNHPGGSISERSLMMCYYKKIWKEACFSLCILVTASLVFCQSVICSPFCSLTHTRCCFPLNGPVGRWAPTVRLWTATSSHWRSAWCAPTWRETRCSGPVDTSLPVPSARLAWRSVSSARIRSSPELR